MSKIYILKFGIVSSFFLLVACAGNQKINDEIKEVSKRVDTYVQQQEESREERDIGGLKRRKGIYVGGQVTRTNLGLPIPHYWTADEREITSPDAKTLKELAPQLRLLLGKPVIVDETRPVARGQDKQKPVATLNADGINFPTDPLVPQNLIYQTEQAAREEDKPIKHNIDIKGTRQEILDQLAGLYGVEWRNEPEFVSLTRYVTRTWTIMAVAVTKTMTTGTASQGGSAGNGKRAGGLLPILDSFKAIKKLLEDTVLPPNATIVATPETGTITVTCEAHAMPRVEKAIADANRRLGRMVEIQFEIYSVTSTERDQSALNINLMYRDLNDKFGFTFRGVSPAFQTSGNQVSASILTPPEGSLNVASPWAGTNAFAESLKRLGNVDQVYHNNEVTMNNRPAVFTLQSQKRFIESVILSSLGDGSQSGITTSEVNQGFSLYTFANIQDDNTVVLDIDMDLAELDSIEALSSGIPGAPIVQSPNLNATKIFREVNMASGEMMILQGFKRRTLRSDNTKGGSGLCAVGLCGNSSTEGQLQRFFVVLRVMVLDPPKIKRGRRT